jgi:hypothetical protein
MWTVRFVAGVGALMLLSLLGACGGGGGGSASGSGSSGTQPLNPMDMSAPSISITAPSATGSFSTTASSVALAGSASDNVGVASVSWRNAANGTSGNASGTGSWSIPAIALVSGVNTVTVTARDAAGNGRNATLAVTYNPGGTNSLSGNVDSSLINRNGSNAVYVYSGTVTPDDLGGTGAHPLTTAPVTQDNGACTFSYQLTGLTAGTYTVAFTNQAANDNPATNDAITFSGTAQVTVGAGGGAVHDFLPARRLQVGPTRGLLRPSAAAAVALDGDVIEIDAGEYLDDVVVWHRNNLTLRGVGGGRAHVRATHIIPFDGTDTGNGKGIWVTSANNISVENVELSGASVPDQNGAGIRADGSGLTVCNGYLHDNENGLLGGVGVVLIEYSEFGHNGFGDGFTHNMYIGSDATRFTLRYSYSHHAHIGHTVKSRAQENYILYNRIMDEADGDSSYTIDLPNGGLSYVIGNLLQQGPNTDNSTILAYGAEGLSNANKTLYVVNNTFVNDLGSGTFVSIAGGSTATVQNNLFVGSGTLVSGVATQTSNLRTSTPNFVNIATFDYRPTASTPGINQGTAPGLGGTFDLTPAYQYLHPLGRQVRPVNGTIDIGAYEFQ